MIIPQKRFKIFYILLTVFTLIVLVRYGIIMLTPTPGISSITFPEIERGPILDRNGKLLALQTELDSVEAWLPNVEDPEHTAKLLSENLKGTNYEILLDNLKNPNDSKFCYIKRKISPTEAEKITSLLGEGHLKGISIKPEFGRNYPEKELAAHVIGYTGTDNVGLNGIEYIYNNDLSPPVININQDIIYGNQVYLTIDLNIQYIIEKIAEKAYIDNKADKVMIMVMGAKSGEILSYVSIPTFDPNSYGKYPTANLENNPATYAYEPGSVFKIFSVASFLELGGITEADTFNTTGGYNPDIFIRNNENPIGEADLANYGVLNAEKTLIYSSNVGVSYMSERVDSKDYYKILKNFGFGQPTGIPLNGESSGIFRSPDRWSIRSKPTISFGQEISVSAIQMLAASTVFANSGVLLKPHIIKKVVAPDGTIIKEYKREPIREVVSADVADSVLHMMQKVTEEGTARKARIEGFNISAKTGTAQVTDSKTGTYSPTEFVGSILAIFPTEDPQIIVYIVIDRPMGDYTYGGRIGSPMVKEIAEELIPILGLNLSDSKKLTHTGNIRISRYDIKSADGTLPDFTSYPKRSVLDYIRKNKLELNMNGDGWVVFQFPPPGTPIEENMTIYVELK